MQQWGVGMDMGMGVLRHSVGHSEGRMQRLQHVQQALAAVVAGAEVEGLRRQVRVEVEGRQRGGRDGACLRARASSWLPHRLQPASQHSGPLIIL